MVWLRNPPSTRMSVPVTNELARALACEPKLLLLDEMVSGMNQEETEDIARFVLDIRDERGITVLMIEHDMRVVMDISDSVQVLNFGERIAGGVPDEVRNDPKVRQAYLGNRTREVTEMREVANAGRS